MKQAQSEIEGRVAKERGSTVPQAVAEQNALKEARTASTSKKGRKK